MGIKSLNSFLKTKCPQAFEHIHISNFRFKKVALDISIIMYKLKSRGTNYNWIADFLKLLLVLRDNDVHCTLIYDSGSPPEKALARKKRGDARQKSKEKLSAIKRDLELFKENGTVSDLLMQISNKSNNQPRLLKQTTQIFNVNAVELKISTMEDQDVNISPEDWVLTKNLCDIMDIPWYDAPLEAETMCADLMKRGLVDAVLSEDTDVLAHGSDLLSKFNTVTKMCVLVRVDDICKALELTYDQFVDLCIMCGNDMNDNIPGIGPSKAYNLLLKHGSIDAIGENTKHDISILNHKRTREIFVDYDKHPVDYIPCCGKPNYMNLERFMIVNNINLLVNDIKYSLEPKIVFN